MHLLRGGMKTQSNQHKFFGLLVTFIFIALFIDTLIAKGFTPNSFYYLILCLLTLIILIFSPNWYLKPYYLWIKLGALMGRVVSPLVLGVIFFAMIAPLALVTRLCGRDELRLKRLKVHSYWIDRIPHGPSNDSFNNQF